MIRFLKKLYYRHEENYDRTDCVSTSVHVHSWRDANNGAPPTTFEEAMEDGYGHQVCHCGAERWAAFENDKDD